MSQNTRRDFLNRSVVQTAALGIVTATASEASPVHDAPSEETPALSTQPTDNAEWRNRQSGMAYRRLGRTNLMISEVISGGDPIRTDNYRHLDLALEMGLNYLDMAPAYGDGDCELAYGKFLGGSAKRNKVFLQTKVSEFSSLRNRMYGDIFKGLPAEKQSAVLKQVDDLRHNGLAEKPGYYLTYFPGQQNQFPPSVLSTVMMRNYAHQVEGSQEFRKCIQSSINGSLQRVGTDHFDLLMCPHGAVTTDELDNPHIYETFQELKKAGKVRYLGVTSHNDPAAILRKATELRHYDAVMAAYNVINAGYMDQAIVDASAKDVGFIAMKTAHAVATHHKPLQPVPQWRIDKINRIIAGDMKPPMKAYMWVLQNQHVSAINSNLWSETFVRENLSLAGKKVQLLPA